MDNFNRIIVILNKLIIWIYSGNFLLKLVLEVRRRSKVFVNLDLFLELKKKWLMI